MSAFLRAHRFILICIVAYVLFTTTAIFALLPDWGNDDPYITYRYAENLYAGRGFVYNPGERILSTTSPLFALILAGVRTVWSNLPRAANLIGAASLAVGALFMWDIARQWKQPLAGWAALALYPTFSILVRTLGSETPFYLALCLGAIAFYLRQKYTVVAILLALAILARGDAVLVGAVLAGDWWIKTPIRSWRGLRTLPWTAIAVGGGILLAWALIAVPYFGSPLPITLAVKRAQGLMLISEKFAPGFLTVLRPYTQDIYFWFTVGLWIWGLLYMFRSSRAWFLLVVWAVLYFISYSVLGVTRYFWYYAPLVPAMVGMIGLGLEAFQRSSLWPGSNFRLPSWAAVLILAGMAIFQAYSLTELPKNPDARLRAYRMVGEWLTQNTLPKAQIGALEVGVIGYYAAPRPMVDFAGLIQPDVANLFAPEVTYQNTAIWAIATYQPNFIVLHDDLFPFLEETFIAQSCDRVQRFSSAETGYPQDLSVYKCKYP